MQLMLFVGWVMLWWNFVGVVVWVVLFVLDGEGGLVVCDICVYCVGLGLYVVCVQWQCYDVGFWCCGVDVDGLVEVYFVFGGVIVLDYLDVDVGGVVGSCVEFQYVWYV